MQALKIFGMIIGGAWLLLVGSCVAIGYGTSVAVHSVSDTVQEFAESDTAERWGKNLSEVERRAHNDEINRESTLDSRYSEYDNYE